MSVKSEFYSAVMLQIKTAQKHLIWEQTRTAAVEWGPVFTQANNGRQAAWAWAWAQLVIHTSYDLRGVWRWGNSLISFFPSLAPLQKQPIRELFNTNSAYRYPPAGHWDNPAS